MLELQHPITSILGITFKDLFPGYFVLVFLTYVFQWSTISRLLSHRNLTGIVLSHENTALSVPGVRLFLIH